MFAHLLDRKRAMWVGGMIIAAYSMLTYTITGNKPLGVITDLISGAAVIGIPVLLFPFFNVDPHKGLNRVYMAARCIEGALMIAGGLFLLHPTFEPYRNQIYQYIHIYFFIGGALLFYALLYKARLVPRYISIWGFVGSIGLLIMTIASLNGIESPFMIVLIVPIITNELFLAGWLMVKGFNR